MVLMAKMMNCDAVMRQLWDYLDDELTPGREVAVRAHAALCERRYPQYEFEKAFVGAVAASRREHARPDEIKTRALAALREEKVIGET